MELARYLGDNLAVVAALLASAGVVWRGLRLGKLLRGVRLFLEDWQGEAARPGVDARRSFPERMADVESGTAAVTARLAQLAEGVARLEATQVTAAAALADADERITEHRRRNDELVGVLQLRLDELRHQQLLDATRAGRPPTARTRASDYPARERRQPEIDP